MDVIQVYTYIEKNKELLFPNNKYSEEEIENAMIGSTENIKSVMDKVRFRSPGTVQMISVFPGSLGVDRFYLGEIALGFLKYITLGGLGIWWIIDMYTAKSRCRAYNCAKLLSALNIQGIESK